MQNELCTRCGFLATVKRIKDDKHVDCPVCGKYTERILFCHSQTK